MSLLEALRGMVRRASARRQSFPRCRDRRRRSQLLVLDLLEDRMPLVGRGDGAQRRPAVRVTWQGLPVPQQGRGTRGRSSRNRRSCHKQRAFPHVRG